MSNEPTLTTTLPDGRTATVAPHAPQPGELMRLYWDVTINCELWVAGNLHRQPKPRGPVGETVPCVGTGDRVLQLTQAEADTLRAAEKALVDAERAASEQTPRGQRRKLVRALEAALDVEEEARRRTMDEGASWGQALKASEAVEAAEQALGAFDRTHPDLVAELEAERRQREDQAVERAWNS